MPSRKILVLGATGATGREVVSQGLQQGHEVTAFVRRAERMTTRSERLRVIVGDVTSDGGALDDAVRSQEVVISALGIGKSFRPRGFIARSVPRILEAMRRQRVGRLVFTSAFGVGDTWRDTPILPRIFIRTLLRCGVCRQGSRRRAPAAQRARLDPGVSHRPHQRAPNRPLPCR